MSTLSVWQGIKIAEDEGEKIFSALIAFFFLFLSLSLPVSLSAWSCNKLNQAEGKLLSGR